MYGLLMPYYLVLGHQNDNDPTAAVRPEQGLLLMRKKLGFANVRPHFLFN
jgi:3-isopropylmalate dehydrogenase